MLRLMRASGRKLPSKFVVETSRTDAGIAFGLAENTFPDCLSRGGRPLIERHSRGAILTLR